MVVIIVLGSPNFPDGTLGPIAIDRLRACISIFNSQIHKILCTGGYGAHFNTSALPHSYYLKNYLIKNGIPENSFLPEVFSSNTVEDAVMSEVILQDYDFKDLLIITSQYHQARVKFIFTKILKGFSINYWTVTHQDIDEQLIPLINHEKKALHQIKSNGLYF